MYISYTIYLHQSLIDPCSVLKRWILDGLKNPEIRGDVASRFVVNVSGPNQMGCNWASQDWLLKAFPWRSGRRCCSPTRGHWPLVGWVFFREHLVRSGISRISPNGLWLFLSRHTSVPSMCSNYSICRCSCLILVCTLEVYFPYLLEQFAFWKNGCWGADKQKICSHRSSPRGHEGGREKMSGLWVSILFVFLRFQCNHPITWYAKIYIYIHAHPWGINIGIYIHILCTHTQRLLAFHARFILVLQKF